MTVLLSSGIPIPVNVAVVLSLIDPRLGSRA
jgi:hypothetical protein